MLIVGCGCRGRALGEALEAEGHRVRGTSRSREGRAAIEAAGLEAAAGDPDRLGTLLPLLGGVSAVCWLMGTARGEAAQVAALHGPRLQSMVDRLVDTPVRGMVYEASGTVDADLLAQGASLARAAAATYRMPLEVVGSDPAELYDWRGEVVSAVGRVLGSPG